MDFETLDFAEVWFEKFYVKKYTLKDIKYNELVLVRRN